MEERKNYVMHYGNWSGLIPILFCPYCISVSYLYDKSSYKENKNKGTNMKRLFYILMVICIVALSGCESQSDDKFTPEEIQQIANSYFLPQVPGVWKKINYEQPSDFISGAMQAEVGEQRILAVSIHPIHSISDITSNVDLQPLAVSAVNEGLIVYYTTSAPISEIYYGGSSFSVTDEEFNAAVTGALRSLFNSKDEALLNPVDIPDDIPSIQIDNPGKNSDIVIE